MHFIVNIDVPDLAAATRFYCDAFGLRVGRKLSGSVELLGGPTPVYLLENEPGSAATASGTARRDFARHWTPVPLEVVTDDIEAAVSRAVAAGAVLEKPAERQAWGDIALLADPFGNGFCIIRFNARGYDAIAEPEA